VYTADGSAYDPVIVDFYTVDENGATSTDKAFTVEFIFPKTT
jgi:hypothetical protein